MPAGDDWTKGDSGHGVFVASPASATTGTAATNCYGSNIDKGDAYYDLRHRVVFSGAFSVPTTGNSAAAKYLLGGWTVVRDFWPFGWSDENFRSPFHMSTEFWYTLATVRDPSPRPATISYALDTPESSC